MLCFNSAPENPSCPPRSLEKPHSLVMLLVPWKRLIFGPPFLFQISNDVQPRCLGSLVTPKFARLLNACKVMAQLAVAHPVGRLARKLIQPAMHFLKRLSQHGCRFRAVLCERRHKLLRVQSLRKAIASVHLLGRRVSDRRETRHI